MDESIVPLPAQSKSNLFAVIFLIIATIAIILYFSKKQEKFVPFILSTVDGKEVATLRPI